MYGPSYMRKIYPLSYLLRRLCLGLCVALAERFAPIYFTGASSKKTLRRFLQMVKSDKRLSEKLGKSLRQCIPYYLIKYILVRYIV